LAEEHHLTMTVARKQSLAQDVVELELRAAAGDALPNWEPGAHIDVHTAAGTVRQYSLCGDPADCDIWSIAILREPTGRGGSVYLHDQVVVGDTVEVGGPRNHFVLEPSPRYLFIAGGIGITPIIAMVDAAIRAGADWHLLYGGRSRASMAYLDRIRDLPSARVTVCPQDENGLLNLGAVLGTTQADTLVYCCGPEPLLDAVAEQCVHWPQGTLHIERFTPRELNEPIRKNGFTVELKQSGGSYLVTPDQSILEVLRDAGVYVPAACEEGTCGTCETRLLAGVAEHRDSVMTPDEQAANDTIFVCVSRSVTDRLVLDL
jgi:ferredoxin-NADP reductase